jgi:hypothetical protein
VSFCCTRIDGSQAAAIPTTAIALPLTYSPILLIANATCGRTHEGRRAGVLARVDETCVTLHPDFRTYSARLREPAEPEV